jgi:hypothetical protein
LKIRPYQSFKKERDAIIALFERFKIGAGVDIRTGSSSAIQPPVIHQISLFHLPKKPSWMQPVAGSLANPSITGA